MLYNKIDIVQLASKLTRPFMLQLVARLDHFGIYLYLAHGAVASHRHPTQDELFYVINGMLTIETEIGQVVLQSGEMAMIPRGIEHASSSMENTSVLLAQVLGDPERKNGHGRTIPARNQPVISRLAPFEVTHGLTQPFFSVALTQVDEIAVRAAWCQGVVGWHRHAEHDELLMVLDGQLNVGTEAGTFALKTNELVVIPRQHVHHLSTTRQTLLLSLVHSDLSPSAQMGHAN